MTVATKILDRRIPEGVRRISSRLAEGGFHSWIVGGSVRDSLLASREGKRDHPLGLAASDWDMATTARPEDVQRLFPRVIPTGIQHGTVTVLQGSTGYEVTTLRGETTYSDGRRPDSVYFVDDISEDLARRDFTVNALAYDPLSERLIDPFGGVADLENRALRAVGDPSLRFAEDGLRVLRAARFVATLEFELDPRTAAAILPSLDSYRKVSPERIRQEWIKAMSARKPSRAFAVMREHGILAVTAPELLESVGCEQNRYHAYDVWRHALECLDHCPKSAVLRLAGLLHDIGKPRSRAFSDKTQDYTFYNHERIGAEMVEPLLWRLRFSNEERARVAALVRHHLICYDEGWSDAAVRRWVQRVTPELLADLYALNEADILAKGKEPESDLARLLRLKEHVKTLLAEGAAFGTRDLAINGRDLMQHFGLPPGPKLGEILRSLLETVLDDPSLNTKDALLERAKALTLDPGCR